MGTQSPELPHFSKPPLIDVICGVQFAPLDPLMVPHFGLLWAEKYRPDYPITREADPLAPVIERFGEPVQEPTQLMDLPLPRVWFLQEKENALVQVQRDRFLYNWKKMGEGDQYPRY